MARPVPAGGAQGDLLAEVRAIRELLEKKGGK